MLTGRMKTKEKNPFFSGDFSYDVKPTLTGRMAKSPLDLNARDAFDISSERKTTTPAFDMSANIIPHIPQAIKETLIGADPEFAKIYSEYQAGDINALQVYGKSTLATPKRAVSMVGDLAKSMYGFLATPGANISALQKGEELPTEVKIPFTEQTAPLLSKTYLDARDAGLSPFWATISTLGRTAGDILLIDGVVKPVVVGVGKIPVTKATTISLTFEDLVEISAGRIKAGSPKYDAWTSFEAKTGLKIGKILKEKGKVDVTTGKSKTLMDVMVEQYAFVKGSEAGFVKTPFKGRMAGKEVSIIEQKIAKAKAEGKSFDEFVDKKTVFHGSNKEITEFDKNLIGQTTGNEGYFGKGFYFTPDKTSAGMFAENAVRKTGGKRVVGEYVLEYKKPFVINKDTDVNLIKKLVETSSDYSKTGGASKADNLLLYITENPTKFAKNLKNKGYDAVEVYFESPNKVNKCDAVITFM